MTWIFFAFAGAVAVLVATGFTQVRKEVTDRSGHASIRTERQWKLGKKSFLALLPLLLILGGCIAAVPAGHTGVLVTFGKVESKVLAEGINFKLLYQQVINIDNRVQKEPIVLEAFSSDIQQTNVAASINFTIDKPQSQNLYRNVGINYYQTVIYPRALENIKLVFSAYTAEGLIGMRTELSALVKDLMVADMSEYGIQVIDVNIENIAFTDIFTEAVEAKQVAQQTKLTIQTEQESQIIIARAEAEKRIIAATADAETAQIAADADAYRVEVKANAEAEANRAVAASITEALLEYNKILQWNGTVPDVQIGSGETVYPVINLPEGE
jgi:regulator of protease activity HflC (stomatin/prohibitin superfamily)